MLLLTYLFELVKVCESNVKEGLIVFVQICISNVEDG